MTAPAAIPSPEVSALTAAAKEIYNALLVLLAPGSVAELRCPKTQKGTLSGYYSDFQLMATEAADLSGQVPAVFVTLNPVNPALLARAVNQYKPYAQYTTADEDILNRRWFPLDFDAKRPSGISATDVEHEAALARARECRMWLTAQGWPEPLTADSGNGGHLLYRIELPNDKPARLLVEKVLAALAQKFSDGAVTIDTAVGNAARIWKLYGTQVCKGDSTADRPHRVARWLEIPAELKTLSREQLEAVAALAAAPASNVPAQKNSRWRVTLDVAGWLVQHGITVESQAPYQDGQKFILAQCPLNPEHKKTAFVIQFASGAISAGCLHESCASLNWKRLQAIYEPEPAAWREQLLLSDTGTIKPLLANALLVLRNAPEWIGVLAYNEFSLCAVTQQPAPWLQSTAGAEWSDFDDSQTAAWLQRYGVAVNSRVAAEAAQTVAKENPFHPVQQSLESLIWDGSKRVDLWLSTYLGVPDSAYTRAVGAAWLISAVARIYRPGCQADYVLLLEGAQGVLKSSALRALTGDEWFSDTVSSELGSKDSRVELHGSWIVELGECDRIKRGELERVKSFITARFDKFRPPYGRRSATFPRSCIFAATTNDESPFTDPTGNRRFWPVRCARIDIEALKRDRSMLWAEALVRFRAGEPWWLVTQELNDAATEAQDQRYQPGVWDEQILNWCDDPRPRSWREEDHTGELAFDSTGNKVTLQDVLVHSIGKTIEKISYADTMQVQRCLVHNGWRRLPQSRVRGTGRRVRFYERVPPLPPETVALIANDRAAYALRRDQEAAQSQVRVEKQTFVYQPRTAEQWVARATRNSGSRGRE
jgi:predicted P-loop ATPase